MPYVEQDIKDEIEEGKMPPQSVGQLTFALTLPIRDYLAYIRSLPLGIKYEHLADVLAALEGCKLEFARQVVAPYENEKIAMNGNIDWGVKGNGRPSRRGS